MNTPRPITHQRIDAMRAAIAEALTESQPMPSTLAIRDLLDEVERLRKIVHDTHETVNGGEGPEEKIPEMVAHAVDKWMKAEEQVKYLDDIDTLCRKGEWGGHVDEIPTRADWDEMNSVLDFLAELFGLPIDGAAPSAILDAARAYVTMTPKAGAEAEELRTAIEASCSAEAGTAQEYLRAILDRVDARDSLAWLQGLDALDSELGLKNASNAERIRKIREAYATVVNYGRRAAAAEQALLHERARRDHRLLRIVCAAMPGPGNECVFVELEDDAGRSVRGEWRTRADGLVELLPPAQEPIEPETHPIAGIVVAESARRNLAEFGGVLTINGIEPSTTGYAIELTWAPPPAVKHVSIVSIEGKARRIPLTARPDWTLTPPDDSGTWEPYAYLVGGSDGWDLYWTRKGTVDPGENGPEKGTEIPWPFDNEAIAEEEDFAAIGFRVER